MEAAIRWARGPTPDTDHFLLVDVAGNCITLNEAQKNGSHTVQSKVVARYDKVPNFTAFDWSKADSSLVALGLSSGDASLVRISSGMRDIEPLRVFPIKTQRKCNSITFNLEGLVATGLDRVRNDHCLTVYDVNEGKEPRSRLCTGEAVSSVRFFPNQPQELVAAVARTTIRLYDLRDPSHGTTSSGSTAFTKQVHNISIDPLDDNYFASGGATGDPSISIWDRRWLNRPNASPDGAGSPAIMELRPAVDNTHTTTIWSVRFSGRKRGRFGLLSSTGDVKLYDLATHSVQPKIEQPPLNYYGGNAWLAPDYVAKTHNLEYSHLDRQRGHDEKSRCIAFDWVGSGSSEGQSMLALRPSREVEILHAPSAGRAVITNRNDLAVVDEDEYMRYVEPQSSSDRLGAELSGLRTGDTLAGNGTVIEPSPINDDQQPEPRPLNARSLGALKHGSISRYRTEKWLQTEADQPVAAPIGSSDIGASLGLLDVHRRRCQQGYRLDCNRNREIVRDDPLLARLWAIITRLDNLARNGGMVTQAFDLSYLGVHAVWHAMKGEGRNRLIGVRKLSTASFGQAVTDIVQAHGLPKFDNMPKETYGKRLLGLEICGWCFSREGVEAKCSDLLNQRQYYRAIAIATFQGHIDLALLMLRNISRRRLLPDTGIGALLASEALNDEQREMSKWMEEDATDPYLQALLRYVRERDWHQIVDNKSLNLSDRLSVALRYLSDVDVGKFIDDTTQRCVNDGDVTGVLLTGLSSTSMELFQTYLTRTNDIQTVVLATAYTNPLYVDDVRWNMWKETYFWYMQTWRAFIERTKFNVEHSRRSVSRQGDRVTQPPPRQITLRCVHCNESLAHQQDTNAKLKSSMSFDSLPGTPKTPLSSTARKVAEASGTVCSRCGRHLPRCSICMQWLGTPDMSKVKAAGTGEKDDQKDKEQKQVIRERELLSRFVTFCASCGHGFHATHARQWFAKHGMCPVPDCRCLCGLDG